MADGVGDACDNCKGSADGEGANGPGRGTCVLYGTRELWSILEIHAAVRKIQLVLTDGLCESGSKRYR